MPPNPNLDELEVDYTEDLDEEDEDSDRQLEGRRTRQKTSLGPGYVETSAEAFLQGPGEEAPISPGQKQIPSYWNTRWTFLIIDFVFKNIPYYWLYLCLI